MSWTLAIMTIIEIVKNLSKVLPKWYEGWTKRKDLIYLNQRDKIRREKAKLWRLIQLADGDEKARLLEEYLDRFIRR